MIGLILLRDQRVRDALVVAAACALVLLPWVIWSTVRFGSPFPDSGFIKAHFPDWREWERLSESSPLVDGSAIVVLRIPGVGVK